MTKVGARCSFLKSSPALRACLKALGARERFAASQVLFREEDTNVGVFLLLRGKIRMSVKGLPKLDRLFSAGSLLGLPSTFTGHAYSLTAQAVTEAETVRVPQASFLQLMKDRSDLCQEATEMLGREVTFIQGALAERRRQAARNKVSPAEMGALM
jgi:CRP-like cAMP-binding protein